MYNADSWMSQLPSRRFDGIASFHHSHRRETGYKSLQDCKVAESKGMGTDSYRFGCKFLGELIIC
jgi:hypothetical protein